MKSAKASRTTQALLRKLSTDDRRLWDVLFGIWGYPAVFVAQELGFFELVAGKALTIDEICRAKRLKPRGAHMLLAVCTSLGLMSYRNQRYGLTPLSRQYLLPGSPYYFGYFFDAWRKIFSVWSPDSVRDAVLTDKPQGVFSDPTGVFAAWHAQHARDFTLAMHAASIGPAMVWPRKVDLARTRVMLDVGGGSGAHSIGAVTMRPKLRAIVLDQPPVCAIAEEMARKCGVADRISTRSADFFADPYSEADLHFYGMIFHDWPPERDRLLARKSFESLPRGGRIVIHEMLFNKDRTGPFSVAAFNADMLVAMPGQQYSGQEIAAMLKEAGFTKVQVKPTFGYWSIVTGVKP
jgi:ubiquinone/menaquinone biosynthesis C-methylase UbiE